MIYALWEIVVPLIVVFVIGALLGAWVQRGRGTRVSAEQWDQLTTRALAADRVEDETSRRAPHDAEIGDLRAALEVRDIEIAQLRKAITDNDHA